MKYSTEDLLKTLAMLITLAMLYLTLSELKVALSGSSASAQTVPCTTASPTPSNPPSATPSAKPSASPSVPLIPSPTPTPSPSPTAVPNNTVFLTEFMACPESGNEWLELYNSGDAAVTVSNWLVIDAANNKKTINGTIASHSFSTFEWSGSLLNNAGDSFKIQTASGQVLAEASYSTCTPGISFVYENDEWTGALASPNEETEVSEHTIKTATAAASLALQPATTDSTRTSFTTSATNEIASTNFDYQTPSVITTSVTSQPTIEQNISTQQSKSSNAPALSVILGGLLQLASGSYALYETFFKDHV